MRYLSKLCLRLAQTNFNNENTKWRTKTNEAVVGITKMKKMFFQ